jgi:hypothetical protein
MVTVEEVGHKVVAVADPVRDGNGSTLHEMVVVVGQVMVTWATAIVTEAKRNQSDKANPGNLLLRKERCGLAPG